jgi:hypothetical protein
LADVALLRVKVAELSPAIGTFFRARPTAFITVLALDQDNAAPRCPHLNAKDTMWQATRARTLTTVIVPSP